MEYHSVERAMGTNGFRCLRGGGIEVSITVFRGIGIIGPVYLCSTSSYG